MKIRGPAYEWRLVLTAVTAIVPLTVIALVFAFGSDTSPKARWTALFFIGAAVFVGTIVLHDQVVYPLRTLANLLTALREEDYSLRARAALRDDSLGEVMIEVNALASMLQSRKLEAVEAAALLRAVIAEIDAAIFAFDGNERLQLANRAAERLLATPVERLAGLTAEELRVDDLLDPAGPEAVDRAFPGGHGRWSVRRSTFREQGQPRRLLVIADITSALREEETRAWQRIVRVLGHELNNSLAPIKSIGSSIESLVARDPLPPDWRDDVVRGARVISSRADALTRFTNAYAELARLPRPVRTNVLLDDLVRRVAALETRVPIYIDGGPQTQLEADDAQLEQMLINLVKNAAEASLESGGGVALRWRHEARAVVIQIEDEGPGISSTANLFVPFFTTKREGTGIGLVLSRQIAEAHGGSVTLENRASGAGSVATVTLPLG